MVTWKTIPRSIRLQTSLLSDVGQALNSSITQQQRKANGTEVIVFSSVTLCTALQADTGENKIAKKLIRKYNGSDTDGQWLGSKRTADVEEPR